MGVALLILGAIIIAAAMNDKLSDLGTLVKGDLFGSKEQSGFIAWAAAIIVIAAIMRGLSLPDAGRMLIILIVLAYILGHHDIPGQILNALKGASTEGGSGPPPPPSTSPAGIEQRAKGPLQNAPAHD